MKIIKVVCHQHHLGNAISNLAAVLSAIHNGEQVTMAEVMKAALDAVKELESQFGSENAAVRALLQAEEFDQVKVNFMVSDLEGDAAGIYWNINDLPAGAKTATAYGCCLAADQGVAEGRGKPGEGRRLQEPAQGCRGCREDGQGSQELG